MNIFRLFGEIAIENDKAKKSIDETVKKAKKSEPKLSVNGKATVENSKANKAIKETAKQAQKAEPKLDIDGKVTVKNSKANKAINDTVKHAENAKSKLNISVAKIGKVAGKVASVGAAAIGAVAGIMVNLADNTREYRTEMGKLDTAFTVSGHSSESAKATYKSLYGVLGETDQAVEAAQHIAQLARDTQELQTWADICTGVYATFGNSLPVESLMEACNETAKTGKVTGTLADALNWAGLSEDEFNMTLAACSSQGERQGAIMDTLTKIYGSAAEQYKTTNKEVIASNQAHDNLNAAMAKLGAAAEPAVTLVINACAKLAEAAVPLVEGVTTVVLALGDAWVKLDEMMKDITASITVQTNNQAAAVSSVGSAVTGATGSSFWGALAETIVGSSTVNPDAPWLPGFEKGLPYVPRDNFVARLHEGEAVLTKQEAGAWRNGSGDIVSAVREAFSGVQFNVVLDTGVMVGQLAPKFDAKLGTIAGQKGRGN